MLSLYDCCEIFTAASNCGALTQSDCPRSAHLLARHANKSGGKLRGQLRENSAAHNSTATPKHLPLGRLKERRAQFSPTNRPNPGDFERRTNRGRARTASRCFVQETISYEFAEFERHVLLQRLR
jgi:hypothetical protein